MFNGRTKNFPDAVTRPPHADSTTCGGTRAVAPRPRFSDICAHPGDRVPPGTSNHSAPHVPRSGAIPVAPACVGAIRLMISVVHGPQRTRSALVIRVLALLTLTWIIGGAPASAAVADSCAYASIGPDGTDAVAVAGDGLCTISPPPPTPTPPPTPKPPPPPPPAPPPKIRPKPPPPTPPPPPPPASPTPRPPVVAPPPRPAPPPAPKPRPTPTPSPTPTARPKPSATPVSYPAYRAPTHKHSPRSGPSLVSLTLLVTVPALLAVAALRPR